MEPNMTPPVQRNITFLLEKNNFQGALELFERDMESSQIYSIKEKDKTLNEIFYAWTGASPENAEKAINERSIRLSAPKKENTTSVSLFACNVLRISGDGGRFLYPLSALKKKPRLDELPPCCELQQISKSQDSDSLDDLVKTKESEESNEQELQVETAALHLSSGLEKNVSSNISDDQGAKGDPKEEIRTDLHVKPFVFKLIENYIMDS